MIKDFAKACFFTGHRKIARYEMQYIKETTGRLIEDLIINHDVKDFITGGAVGFDTIAAIEVLRMKEKYPNIYLHLYFPCINQSAKWNENDKILWENIKNKADSFKFITNEPYITGCMQLRNHAMVNDAYYGISYCKTTFGGTYQTIRYAKDKGRNVFIIR